ncbi:uncharacterized protein LOC124300503 [Neodiprion virginianus]|uniref:uncharacterized protein LOC124300503 n=1 Tax=Neodiprion virginianus TaxID=2961670 RepID=UPI001EE77341|nr:uncharacterized protein LOC124300503 [Neodiprion virginianus]
MLSVSSLLLLLILSGAKVSSKPIERASEAGAGNEIDTGLQGDYKREAEVGEVPGASARTSNDQLTSGAKRVSPPTSSTLLENVTVDDGAKRPQGLAWILAPFAQKVQFSPQTFFQDRIGELKESLSHLGSIVSNDQGNGSKQFANGALANLIGLNDSGFYTNRFDPAGFFGGNGWFANKGGILGGPGAFVSTGSILTDYPTAYRK